MARFIVNSADDAGGLSLAEALARANSSGAADRISFDPGLIGETGIAILELAGTIDIAGTGGRLTIDGDVDGDGLADVVLQGGDGPHLEVQAGASVTIRGVDFIGGFQLGEFGAAGTPGTPGTSGLDGVRGANVNPPVDGTDGQDALDDAGNGGAGEAGGSAVGAILNRGDLTLERVGFGGNAAQGVPGSAGGAGGRGGEGGSGGDAGGQRPFLRASLLDVPLPETDTEAFTSPVSPASGPVSLGPVLPPSVGGDGARGGNAGNGGRGGDGGDAAGAILNADGGTLSLTDVSFGGRLASGLMTLANRAIAGDSGVGGFGGEGGRGGAGGDGGNGTTKALSYATLDGPDYVSRPLDPEFDPGNHHQQVIYSISVGTDGGAGGVGGAGGKGGNAGRNGNGGDAATLLNNGTVTGTAAFVTGRATGASEGYTNSATRGTGDSATPRPEGLAGPAGPGGLSGEEYPDRFKALIAWYHWSDDGTSASATSFETDADRQNREDFAEANDILNPREGQPGLVSGGDRAMADSGAEGATGEEGKAGKDGKQSPDVLNAGGRGEVEDSNALVFAHKLGQADATLAFNIIRLGDIRDDLTIGWRLVGNGRRPVEDADFAGSTLPEGVVTLRGTDISTAFLRSLPVDRRKNVETVEIEIAGDTLDERREGYRLELIDPGLPSVVLGTAAVTGTIDDSGIAPSGPPEIRGNGRANTLNGSGADEILLGLGGGDRLAGRGGSDTLEGGAGNDSLVGGGGADMLTGGRGRDGLTGGKGPDVIVFGKGDGKDTWRDFADGRDTLVLDSALWSGDLTARQVLNRFASRDGGDVLLDFGRDEIRIEALGRIEALRDDIEIA